MESPRIAIIIPAYNEEATIKDIVKSTINYGFPIVVDDGSEDNTADIAFKYGAKVKKHKINQGYDMALNTGFEIASKKGFKYAITLDADLQHDTSIIPKVEEYLNSGADIVVGIRPRSQRISEKIFKIVPYLVWGLKDPLCGLKGYNMHVYNDIGIFDTFNSIGTELLIRSSVKKKKIIQISIQTKKRKDYPRFGNSFYANYKIFRALIYCLIKIK